MVLVGRTAWVGVRDCPYGICCPWVRGGWDLDALGKFFRRRRRRRRRPLVLDKFSKQIDSSVISHENDICFYLEGRFWEMFSNCFPPSQGEVE